MLLPDLLSNGLRRAPERPCVIEGDRSLTYAEVDARADQLAQALTDRGVRSGDRVALLALSELEYVEIQVAAMRAGVILVPLNFRLAVPELRAILSDCEPELLIHGPGFAEQAAQVDVPRVWHLGSDGLGEAYDVVRKEFQPRGVRPLLDSETVSAILYTSGTTGHAKGAMTSNGTFWARLNVYPLEAGFGPGDTFLFPIPMFHVASSLPYAFIYRGGTVVLMRTFDVGGAADLLVRHRATHAVFVPTIIGRIVEHLAANPVDLGALRLVIYGGSAIAPEVLRRAMTTLGCGFLQGYGMTEAVNATMLRPEEHDPVGRPDLLASAGSDTISYEVKVVGSGGEECPPGSVGEIVIRGPGVMTGYWKAPAATAAAVRDGWLHSGDLGYLSDDGYLFLTDRLKDVIVSGGENVYSREVEDALHEHPAVLEAAVVGIPSEQWGEAVHAVVVTRDGHDTSPEELVAHCKGRLADYKCPKSVDLVDDLPKTSSGKILKRDVRERFWSGTRRVN